MTKIATILVWVFGLMLLALIAYVAFSYVKENDLLKRIGNKKKEETIIKPVKDDGENFFFAFEKGNIITVFKFKKAEKEFDIKYFKVSKPSEAVQRSNSDCANGIKAIVSKKEKIYFALKDGKIYQHEGKKLISVFDDESETEVTEDDLIF